MKFVTINRRIIGRVYWERLGQVWTKSRNLFLYVTFRCVHGLFGFSTDLGSPVGPGALDPAERVEGRGVYLAVVDAVDRVTGILEK